MGTKYLILVVEAGDAEIGASKKAWCVFHQVLVRLGMLEVVWVLGRGVVNCPSNIGMCYPKMVGKRIARFVVYGRGHTEDSKLYKELRS